MSSPNTEQLKNVTNTLSGNFAIKSLLKM